MLTDEQIEQLFNASDLECLSSDDIEAGVKFARAIEAEVRKDDESLIRQMLEALEKSNSEWKYLADSGDAGFWKAEDEKHYQQSEAAITAARARLEKAP